MIEEYCLNDLVKEKLTGLGTVVARLPQDEHGNTEYIVDYGERRGQETMKDYELEKAFGGVR